MGGVAPDTERPAGRLELVEETVDVGGRGLRLLRPPDAEALLDEEAFTREEFLPYWAELWPSGLVLARLVGERELAGMRVLELGCGLALPSLAAALHGARVLATDWAPAAVGLARENASRNGIELEAARVDWSRPARLLEEAPWDLVLAADVLYERRDVDPLLALLPRLVAEDGEVLLADPGRPAAKEFFAGLASRWEVATTRGSEAPQVTVTSLRARAGRSAASP